jgi:transposase InsO family protein
MGKRRTPEQIQRLLREAQRSLAKGLSIADVCRQLGVGESSYHRWRQRFDPTQVDETRRIRELQNEVERLKLLVAELLLDKKMLQDIAKKVVTPTQQRACADYLGEVYTVSQRRVCRVLGRVRSTLRYRRRARQGEQPLVQAIRRLARKYPRWGYRRVWAVLDRQGRPVNIKRVRRLWIALGLKRPIRRRQLRKLGPKKGTSANSCTNRPARFKNDVWTYDFVADRTTDGRALKWLSLVDEYTRECLALHVGRSLTGSDVRRVLTWVIGRRGAPRSIRSDNGSEFICEALTRWLPQKGTEPIPVAAGSPWENGFGESFNSRLRDEFLEAEEFESEQDAREKAKWFRREFNTVRPHSALEYKTPKEFSDECDRGLHGQPPTKKN